MILTYLTMDVKNLQVFCAVFNSFKIIQQVNYSYFYEPLMQSWYILHDRKKLVS
jgi:hypothetical protein